MTRNTADRKTCAWICAHTIFRNCDAQVSIHGKKGKATMNGMIVGAFYNYDCNHAVNGGSEVSSSDETVMNYSYLISASVAVESSIRNGFITARLNNCCGKHRITIHLFYLGVFRGTI